MNIHHILLASVLLLGGILAAEDIIETTTETLELEEEENVTTEESDKDSLTTGETITETQEVESNDKLAITTEHPIDDCQSHILNGSVCSSKLILILKLNNTYQNSIAYFNRINCDLC